MEPYLGEIRMFAGNYAPKNWALCWGTTMAIANNQNLYSLIGITYGGDGRTVFKLPDLRGRVPMGDGAGINLTPRFQGQAIGVENVIIDNSSMPNHKHNFLASQSVAATTNPTEKVLANTSPNNYYEPITGDESIVALHPDSVENVGYGQGHSNIMPVSCINFIICINGQYPPRNNS